MIDLKTYLIDDDRGVSPVIGVILMVAITVILAAVIATFVMNMGPTESTMPNTQWTFDDDGSGDVVIEHNGGGAVDGDNIEIQVAGSTSGVTQFSGSDITAGGSVTVTHSSNPVQIIWKNPDSDETQVMAEWEA